MTWFIIIYFTVMGLGFFYLYKKVFKPTWKWFEECAALEKRIREEDNKNAHIEEFYRLVKFSWIRITGERLRELALMLEIKYNIQLINRD